MLHSNCSTNLDDPQDGGWSAPQKTLKTNKEKQDAIRSGKTEVVEKFGAANHSVGISNAKKLDEDTGSYAHAKVTPEFKKALMQARMAKGLNQKDLAQKCNLQPKVIQEYESGAAVPDGSVIQKLNRVLGVTLPKIPKKKTVKD